MFSDLIKSALEKEVVGQPRAVNTIVRGVTRLMSGMMPRERQLCAYMLMGPTGTGKSHIVHTLARWLHNDGQRALVIDGSVLTGDPRLAFAAQLAPLFAAVPPDSSAQHWSPLEAPPLSIVQVDFLERAAPEASRMLASCLETGQVTLPDGRRGSLRGSLVFMTSGLCSREILDEAPRIGFAGAQGDDGGAEDRISTLCREQAEARFGGDLMGQLDGFVVFHRLQEEHLPAILDRRLARMDRWLCSRGCRCEVQPTARDFLLANAHSDLRFGARDLLRTHQKLVEFPVADLLVSGRLPPGSLLLVDHRAGEEHLHFTVTDASNAPHGAELHEIPIG